MGASIDMLENALRACPEELWTAQLWREPAERPDLSQFWYLAYHCLFWLDLYLFGAVEGFTPPAPFTLAELDPAGLLPERIYTRNELLAYLAHCRQKCRLTIEALSDERVDHLCDFPWGKLPYAELLLDTMRHVQEHAAQLNLFLGQQAGQSARWVARAKAE
jgi:hypothetical protein